MLGKNVHERNKESWRLQLRCNAWADVNDINRRTKPKTVAFESLYGKIPKNCVGSLFFSACGGLPTSFHPWLQNVGI